jgi:choline dehydrogenase
MARKNSTTGVPGAALSRRDMLKRSAGYATVVAAAASGSKRASGQGLSPDYIVIGSGPGGGPVACNLAKAGYQVVLMEAGQPGDDPDLQALMKIPAFFAQATADPRIAWEFFVRHYADNAQQMLDPKYIAADGGILYPRASTIGGCGIHNVLVLMYPSDSDWQNIADITGDESWLPANMRAIFQGMESCRYAAPPTLGQTDTALHGFDGWQPTEMANPQLYLSDPQLTKMIQTAANQFGPANAFAGYQNNTLDPNAESIVSANTPGLFTLPMQRLNGARWGVRDHILETAAEYPNLTIMTNCLVTRVLMDGVTAVGVEYMQGEYLYRASPNAVPNAPAPKLSQLMVNREVIISAGTFNSPQILKLSGIGPAAELQNLGIRVAVDLPGVGANMMDRYEESVVTQLTTPFTNFNACKPGTATDPCIMQFAEGTGIYTTNLTAAAGLIKSNPSLPDRDLMVLLAPGPFHGYFPGWQNLVINPTQFSWLILKAHTQNTAGTVTLQSTDPRDMPLIDFHSFAEGNDTTGTDLAAVVDGIQIARQMNQALGLPLSAELYPGPTVQTSSDVATYVRNTAWGHHAACSNKMGVSTDPSAVVDSDFRVFGTRNLRVVDASVFPKIPGYYPIIAIQMLGEKASDAILSTGSVPPVARPRR